MKKLVTTGIVSLLILTAVLTIPTINAKNLAAATTPEEAETAYASLLVNLPDYYFSDEITLLFDYLQGTELASEMDTAFEGFNENMDQLCDSSTPDEDKGNAMYSLFDIVTDMKTSSDYKIDENKEPSDLLTDDDSLDLYYQVMENISEKPQLEKLLNKVADSIDLVNASKLVLWFVWVIVCTAIIAIPGSLIVIGIIEAMAVALVACVVSAEFISNIAAMDKLFPMGKLTPTQRTIVGAFAVGVVAFCSYLALGNIVHSIALLLGGIVALNVVVDEIVKKLNDSKPSPVTAECIKPYVMLKTFKLPPRLNLMISRLLNKMTLRVKAWQ